MRSVGVGSGIKESEMSSSRSIWNDGEHRSTDYRAGKYSDALGQSKRDFTSRYLVCAMYGYPNPVHVSNHQTAEG